MSCGCGTILSISNSLFTSFFVPLAFQAHHGSQYQLKSDRLLVILLAQS
jgi:hypothetical protein